MKNLSTIPAIIPSIIPAILAKDYTDLEEHLSCVRSLASWVQIDVCDGKFVPTESWPYWKGQYDDFFQKILNEEEGLPYWKDFDFEIDLMVENPQGVLQDWIVAGASRVIVHIESFRSEAPLSSFGSLAPDAPDAVEIGFAINIETPIESLAPFVEKIPNFSCIQCMGIKNVGYQGEAFDPRVLEKISALRKIYPESIISVDGGVSFETAPLLLQAGANRLISGSQIFGSKNIVQSIEYFKSLFIKS
jgi:ribulose-phosphate 3-epimerase